MKYLMVLVVFFVSPATAVVEPNGEDVLTCPYKELDFSLGDPIIYQGKLYRCRYDGGPTTSWLVE